MSDPYQILGVPPDADEATVRQRYLQLVRDNPPERSPERFAEIRAAYDQVNDPVQAWTRRLFDLEQRDTLEDIVQRHSSPKLETRFSTELLLSLGEK